LSLGGLVMLAVALLSFGLEIPKSGLSKRQKLSEILKMLAGEPRLRLPYLFAFLDRFTVGFFVASFPIYAVIRYGFTPGQIGAHIAAFMLTMGLLCRPVVMLSRRFSQTHLLLWGSLIYGAFFASIGLFDPPLLMVWMFLLGAASALMFIPTLQLSAARAPDQNVGASMGGFNSAGSLGFLLGPLVSGVLISLLSGLYSVESAYGIVLFIGGSVEVLVAGYLISRSLAGERTLAD
ncbi:MAG: MFS transporter, partial [Calditrichaeota bacterium]|nr:MFS transporter [Calditrichota bacterium]